MRWKRQVAPAGVGLHQFSKPETRVEVVGRFTFGGVGEWDPF
jgi:hypothetical protein